MIYPAGLKNLALAVSMVAVLVSWVGAFSRWRVAGRPGGPRGAGIG